MLCDEKKLRLENAARMIVYSPPALVYFMEIRPTTQMALGRRCCLVTVAMVGVVVMALHSRSGSFDHKDDSSPLITWNMSPQEDLGYLDVEKRARDALPSTIWGNKFGKIPLPTNSRYLNLISRQE